MQTILHLGSNEGDRFRHLEKAATAIAEKTGVILRQSALYETAAWGKTDQPDFINQSILVETDLPPLQLLQSILDIETRLGRVRTEKWGPRIIDIDILFYGRRKIDKAGLTIPHPHLQNRNFVLIPTMEIAGDWIHPGFDLTVEELYRQCRDTGEVYLLEKDTETKLKTNIATNNHE